MKRFEGKVVVVTGASRGIGGSTAVAFAREGAQVVGIARSSQDADLAPAQAQHCALLRGPRRHGRDIGRSAGRAEGSVENDKGVARATFAVGLPDGTAAVLVGDFVYSRAFQMMVGVQDMKVLRVLADATLRKQFMDNSAEPAAKRSAGSERQPRSRVASSISSSSTRFSCTGGTRGWIRKTSRSRQFASSWTSRSRPGRCGCHRSA